MDFVLNLISIIVLCLSSGYLIYRLIRYIKAKFKDKRTKRTIVIGKVIKKRCFPAHGKLVTSKSENNLNTISSEYHPEEYVTTVKYGDITKKFYKRSLYKHFEVNDDITLVLVQKLNRKNEVIEATLELPE